MAKNTIILVKLIKCTPKFKMVSTMCGKNAQGNVACQMSIKSSESEIYCSKQNLWYSNNTELDMRFLDHIE